MSLDSAMAVATGQTIAPPVSPVEGITEAVTTEQPKELESTRFTHLAKKEAELQKQREEFKKERELINAEKEKLKPIHEKLLKFEELKKTDPVAAIKMLEFSDTDFINYLAAQEDHSTPEEKARKAAQDEINKFQTEMKKNEEEKINAQNQKIISDFKASITSVFSADKDKYELSNHHGNLAEELAYDFVVACVNQGMEAPSAEAAALAVEEYYENYAKDLMTTKKLTPAQAAEKAKEQIAELQAKPEAEKPSTPSKTLSSRATATVASTVTRKETASEKRERLIRKLAEGV